MRPGDEAFYYQTGNIRALVGIVRITGQPHPDPNDPRGSFSVEVRLVRSLRRPIALAVLKEDSRLVGFDLLRNSRLTVLPVPEKMWRRILSYEGRKAPRRR
jgi:predicted RNA-binding protein with PUA-like domain